MNRLPPAGIAQRIDDARYHAAVIPTILLAIIVDHARASGRDPAPWFAGTGLSAPQCSEPNQHVSFHHAMTIIRRAVAAFGDTGLGLAIGGRESLSSFGMLGFAMMSCRTFGDAVRAGLEYHQISGSLLDIEMLPDGQRIWLVARERYPDPELLPFLCEEAFASMSNVSRAMLGPAHRLLQAEFSYPRPRYVHLYEHRFPCSLRFGASHNRMAFDAALLDTPLPTYNPITLAEAMRVCQAQVDAVVVSTEMLASLVRWLRPRLGRDVSVQDAADALRMTERTLRRRLATEGTSFRALHDRLRAERAEQLLRDPRHSIADVGFELGYSDGREFRRAFKRWTGRTPRDYRSGVRGVST